MARHIHKRLVVDACVLRAAGTRDVPDSAACRNVLDTILEISHRAVANAPILAEWNQHASVYARRWWSRMKSKRKLAYVDEQHDATLRRQLVDGLHSEAQRAAALKDAHLLEAARRADRVIVSQDVAARDLFSKVQTKPGLLKSIAWVDPIGERERALEWLRSGARSGEWAIR